MSSTLRRMVVEPGLRERKKQRTRQAITDVAWRLFLERGFDGVSVAEIARQAEVSEATVFNYFPTKEDLVFGRLATFEEEMLAAIRGRPAGDSVTTAFGEFVVQPRGLLGSGGTGAAEAIVASARLIMGSRPLLARQRELWDDYTATLAELIATERGASSDDLEPWVIANALIGVQRSLVADVRRQLLAGEPVDAVVRRVRVRGRRAMSVLQRGLDPTM
jgi:AcrR family transcriptional regulator